MLETIQREMDLIRESDRFLRRWAIVAPVVTFIVGTMMGFVGGIWLYHDLNIRVLKLESWHDSHDAEDKLNFAEYHSFEARVKDRLHLN